MTGDVHPFYLPRRIRREEADNHGYSPSADDYLPLAEHLRPPPGIDALAVFAAQVDKAREDNEQDWAS